MTRVRSGKSINCDTSQATINRKKRPIISDQELSQMMIKAELLPLDFYRLRTQAIIAIFSKTGKRRGELKKLKREDLTFNEDHTQLLINFTLEKKKRHFKLCPQCYTRDKPTHNSATALFCKKCGFSLAETKVTENKLAVNSIKALYLDDPLVKPIIEYLNFLDNLRCKSVWLFPASRVINGNLVILPEKGLQDRQLYNIVVANNAAIWPHLFRETVGGRIVRSDNSLAGLFKVMARLDLENLETAQHYVKRWAGDVIERS